MHMYYVVCYSQTCCYYGASYNKGRGVIVSYYTKMWARSFIPHNKMITHGLCSMVPFRHFRLRQSAPHHYTFKPLSEQRPATKTRQMRGAGRASTGRNFHTCVPNMSHWWAISRPLFDSQVCTNQNCLFKKDGVCIFQWWESPGSGGSPSLLLRST